MQVLKNPKPRESECRRPPERETESVEQLVSHFHTVYDEAASILRELVKITRRESPQDDRPRQN
jgi:hypothetical protein